MKLLPPCYIDVSLAWAEYRDIPDAINVVATPMPAYILWLLVNGELQVTVPDFPRRIPSGSLILFPPEMRRDVHATSPLRWYSVAIFPINPLARVFLKQLHAPAVLHPGRDALNTFEAVMHLLVQESLHNDAVTDYTRGGLLLNLIGLIWRQFGPTESTSVERTIPDWLISSLQQMQRHPGMTVNALAEAAGYSVAHYRHLFSHWLGVPPHAYLCEHQLHLAQSLLLSTDLSVAEISEQVGFKTQSYFTRMFTRAIGIPPLRYRLVQQNVRYSRNIVA